MKDIIKIGLCNLTGGFGFIFGSILGLHYGAKLMTKLDNDNVSNENINESEEETK